MAAMAAATEACVSLSRLATTGASNAAPQLRSSQKPARKAQPCQPCKLAAFAGQRLAPVFHQSSSSRRTRSFTVRAEGGEAAAAPPSCAKGDIVRVDREQWAGSLESYANQPISYRGLEYIFENRGEILELRTFENTEPYALVAWAGIPNPPAWLPAKILIKSDKLEYTRI